MTVQIALLRGVNVGGNKAVVMTDLRGLLADLGYADVVTLLNSGNAVFSAAPARLATAEADVEAALRAKLGVTCSVVVRSGAELVAAMDADPLSEVATDPARHLVGFLAAEPGAGVAEWFASVDVAPDQIRLVGRHVYQWAPAGVSNGPLSKLPWERRLGVAVTSRNVNTLTKLIQLTAQ